LEWARTRLLEFCGDACKELFVRRAKAKGLWVVAKAEG
jgi:1,2-phenylacetyl-CoA epoxidase PaaB subunit